jgi:hypothetical protein
LERKWWLLGGVVIGGTLYARHRSAAAAAAANTASSTGAGVAGSTTDANGNQVMTSADGSGGTPADYYDPGSTSGGYGGSDILLGAGGVVNAPVGQNGTDTGSGVTTAPAAQNPATPGAAATAAPTVNYLTQNITNKKTVEAPTKAAKATHHHAVAGNGHRAQQGKKTVDPHKTTHEAHKPKDAPKVTHVTKQKPTSRRRAR